MGWRAKRELDHDQHRMEAVVPPVPICIDLDGTLVRTDLLHEMLLVLLKQNPLSVLRLPLWLMKGKAYMKRMIAERVTLDVEALPFNTDVLDLIDACRAEGRPIILATASPERVADAVSTHLGVFDDVISSDHEVNLSAGHKAEALCARYGERGFDYVGNSRDDLTVWERARSALVVSASKRVSRAAAAAGNVVREIPDESRSRAIDLARALRPHQWLKNLLIFVPLIAAHEFANPELVPASVVAFLAFSLCASAVYVLNDLLDLAADRRHARKRNRPFASGAISVATGLSMIVPLLLFSALLAMTLPPLFLAVLALYFVVTLAYSLVLKRQVVVDVVLLAGLYTVRLIAGSAATGIELSFWLLAFSMFIFLSLALVKRYSELRLVAASDGEVAGRGYLSADLPVLMALGTSSGMIGVLVLALYIDAAATPATYPSWEWLWLVPPVMLYWVARIWMKSLRGEVHDDPVVFAAKDWQSQVVASCIVLLFVAASAGKA